jgi:hypothetical protein
MIMGVTKMKDSHEDPCLSTYYGLNGGYGFVHPTL